MNTAGSLGETHADTVVNVSELAGRAKVPVVTAGVLLGRPRVAVSRVAVTWA